MKLALLGTDADSLELAQAAVELGHVVTAVAEPRPEHLAALRQAAPALATLEHWESLLDGGMADALIVSRGDNEDQRADQLRMLVQAGMPMLVVHPVHESMLIYYELDMIRQESACMLVSYAPERWHPAVARLAALSRDSQAGLGKLEQIAFERHMPDRSRRSVLARFARDAELARALAGEITKVAAMTAQGAQIDYANLGVQMSTADGTLVRWSVLPADAPSARLVLVGSCGKATLEIPPADADWTLETRLGGQAETESFADWDAPAMALHYLSEAMAGVEVHPNWMDAARDMELADAVGRSAHKGRTIDLHYEEHTEQGTFKGIMAAGGCGLLILSLILVIVATTVANLFRRGQNFPLAGRWPYLLVGVLVAFLLLQLLKLAFPKEK